ncbi:MAG: right-handed parallel beta-helix repeat-containing protein [Candidatus Pacearchaeota archaeon]|nr:right-handed parallel beta-helix repeat-containing protein [Candidatus Pacearchaeota archaeon]
MNNYKRGELKRVLFLIVLVALSTIFIASALNITGNAIKDTNNIIWNESRTFEISHNLTVECLNDSDCFDNNLSTIDLCLNNVCVYQENQTNETENLSSVVPLGDIPNQTLLMNSSLVLDLDEFFSGENLSFNFSVLENEGLVELSIENNSLIINSYNETGVEKVSVSASDGNSTLKSNPFYINVVENISNFTEETTQMPAEIGKPVGWLKKIKIQGNLNNLPKEISVKIPQEANNISINSSFEPGNQESNEDFTIDDSDNKDNGNIKNDTKKVKIKIKSKDNITAINYKIKYETPAPQIQEQIISKYIKRVTITGSDQVHYQNVLAYVNLTEDSRQRIRLYWIDNESNGSSARIPVDFTLVDSDNDSLIDRVEWIVPYLSEQKYEIIIEIIGAEHLDENYTFISDIYNETKALDGVWSEPIYHDEYVRVTFKRNLTSFNDITVYARNNQSLNTSIDVYYFNSSEKITEFPVITNERYYKVYLTNMSGSYDTFDLKIKNNDNVSSYLEFDYIVDPTEISQCQELNAQDTVYTLNQSVTSSDTCFSITASNITLDCNGFWINYSSSSTGYGVTSSSPSTTIKNCNINQTSTSSSSYGIYFSSSDNGIVFNNTVNTLGATGYGIRFDTSSNENITGNNITTSGTNSYGIRFDTSSNNNITNNNITTIGATGYGIYLRASSTNNNFSNVNVQTNNSGANAVYLYDSSPDLIISNSVLNASYSGVADFYAKNSVLGGTWNLTNVSFNKADTYIDPSASGKLSVFWYADAYVNDTAGNSVSDVNVSAYNVTGILLNWSLTDSSGYTPRLILKEYMQNATAKYYQTNYTFNGSKTDYNISSQLVNLTTNRLLGINPIVLTLYDTVAPVAVQGTNPIDNYNSSSSSVTFDIQCSDNIGVSTIQLWTNTTGNWSANYSNSSYANNTWLNITVAGIPSGLNYNYKWAVWCNDSAGNTNITQNRTLNVMVPTGCATLDIAGAYYILTGNVSSEGTCINISASNVTLNCNGFWINYSSSSTGHGVYSNSSWTTIKNCNINQTSTSASSYGIYFNGASSGNGTVFNNTIKTLGATSYGISLVTSSFNNFSDNNITTSGATGYGVYLYNGANSNNFSNNNITTIGTTGHGIYLKASSTNNLFNRVNIQTNNSGANAVYLYDSSPDLIISNSILNASYSGAADFYARDSVIGGTWNLTNVTFNKADTFIDETATGSLSVFWFADVYVSAAGSAVNGANVTVQNVTGTLINWFLTNSSGYTPRLTLQEYMQNATGSYYQTNYTFNAGHVSYGNATSSINLTTNRITDTSNPVVLALGVSVSACQNITSLGIYTLTSNVSSAGTCFNISASNVTLDCNGFTINYSSSAVGYGVYTNSSYTTVKGCVINEASSQANAYNVYFNGASSGNGTVYNNSMTSVGSSSGATAVVFSSSSNNNITNNIIAMNINNYLNYFYDNCTTGGTYNQTFYDNTINATKLNLSFNGGTYASQIFSYPDSNVFLNSLSWTYQRIQCPANMSYINKLNGYCIDKYEASALGCENVGHNCGNYTDVNYCSTICVPTDGVLGGVNSDTGTTAKAYSRVNVAPFVGVSQKQARQMCANAGKHLCTDAEWLGAANIHGQFYNLPATLSASPNYCVVDSGTYCNYAGNSNNACNTSMYKNGASGCYSSEGVYDMTGNVWEWTNKTVDVINPLGNATAGTGIANYYYVNTTSGNWSNLSSADNGKYGKDTVYFPTTTTGRAVIRGGYWNYGAIAGPFYAILDFDPSFVYYNLGFRCCSS